MLTVQTYDDHEHQKQELVDIQGKIKEDNLQLIPETIFEWLRLPLSVTQSPPIIRQVSHSGQMMTKPPLVTVGCSLKTQTINYNVLTSVLTPKKILPIKFVNGLEFL